MKLAINFMVMVFIVSDESETYLFISINNDTGFVKLVLKTQNHRRDCLCNPPKNTKLFSYLVLSKLP
jgi:hypothetical protein